MATVLIWPQMVAYGAGLSLGWSNIYFSASQPQTRAKLFANSVLMALALGLPAGIIGAILIPKALQLTTPQHHLLIIGLLMTPIALWGDFCSGLLQGTSAFGKFGLLRLLLPAVTCMGLFGLALVKQLNVQTAVIVTWIGGLVPPALTVWFLAKNGYAGWRPDLKILWCSLIYSLQVFGGSLASLANKRLDQLIMTAAVAPRLLGLYAFATSISEMLGVVTTAISFVLFPRVAGEIHLAVRAQIALRAARWTVVLGTASAALLASLAPFVVPLIWGQRFKDAVPAIWILLPGVIALGTTATMCACLQAAGKPRVQAVGEIASLIVMLPCLLILLPRWGIIGAAWASTLGYITNCITIFVLFGREFPTSRFLTLDGFREEARFAQQQIRMYLMKLPISRAAAPAVSE